ncbi:MAG: hypothetical protein ATN34_01075 [Epulopiscium sp. Nele67-Bin002]|nr:MAG: hypothetical protein BEN18_05150 [Epulopiscium sp. Nuni2H_MBin001]OON92423.1 MAG: hypothetical protein ATN34_01075 [Epulopiscium sp. Nele67-Bin002]OON93627.1 MAG: hypothetical protein ATN33_05495 [Epulopiscium sp. Nele67-Bin001]
MNMNSYPPEMMPYEKYKKYGINSLTDTDLIAIILGKGTKRYNVMELANKLITNDKGECDITSLRKLKYTKLIEVEGIGEIKAMQIMAVIEIACRLTRPLDIYKVDLTQPSKVAELFMEECKYKEQEEFYVLSLDVKSRLISKDCISVGTINETVVHPREVYKTALLNSANAIIVVHNHPSGDPEPSRADIEFTQILAKAGEFMKITLVDHIIIGNNCYKSLKNIGVI